ncbi:MAG: DUF1631 family protein [Gammaproteobacteria bacterium]|jgi:hypothetical protein
MSAEIHTRKTGGPADNTKAHKNSDDYEDLIRNVFNRLNVQLLQKTSDMLNNADKSLQMLSDNAESSDMQSKYLDLMHILRTERNNIDKAFFIAINESINNNQDAQEELALVDQDEMDEMVTITSMYSNAMNTYGQEVNNLESRFEYLELECGRTLNKHAIDPRHICESFQAAIKQINLTLDYRLLLFKLFDMEVSSRLGSMYKSLNQLFIDAGVMPEIVYKARNLDTDKAAQDAETADKGFSVREAKYYDPQKNKAENFIPRTPDEISYFISQFMNGFTTAKGEGIPESFSTTPTDKDNHNCYSRKELMNALSKLQHQLIQRGNDAETVDTEQIKRAIMADMGSSNGGAVTKKVHVLDQRSIDFVGMMFKEITDDSSISNAITNLLMRLQIPVIKVAMLDEKLFSQEDHPARETLDLVSAAGKGVNDENDRVYQQLELIINGILQEYDVDLASFERAVDALHTLITTEHEIAAETEKQEQREIIRSHARDVVLTEMRHLTTNRKLPKTVQPLILKQWPTLMCNRYINCGRESNEWLMSVMLLKLIMRCLQPIKNESQWEMLNNNHEPLVEAVNDELYETQQDKAEIDAQVSALKQTFLKMLDEYGYKLVAEPAPATPDATDNAVPYVEEENVVAANEAFDDDEHDAEVANIEEQARIAREKISRLPGDLHPGIWFEIFNGDDKPVRRLKLSVVLTEVARLIFVDCHGVKVIEKDAGDFANELENEQSKFIADHSTFEHALGTVIHKLAA